MSAIKYLLLGLGLAGMVTAALGQEGSCFPACAAQSQDEKPAARALCNSETVKQAGEIKDSIKAVKEKVDLVRSPTGLVVKLVNDHVVHIPRWVGIAMDPAGAVKGKAIEKVRAQAKEAIGVGQGTCSKPADGDVLVPKLEQPMV